MTILKMDEITLRRICNGNTDAIDWIDKGNKYCHLIDDVIDEDLVEGNRTRGAKRICAIGLMAIELYTHPFFQKFWKELGQAMATCTQLYAQSVEWEESKVDYQRNFSDWARHAWLDVVLAVAKICGGHEHMMAVAPELRAMSHVDHHDGEKPV